MGTFQSVSTRLLPIVMREFARLWPRVEVQVREMASPDMLPLVERGELDLAFEMLPLSLGPFESLGLLHDPYVLLVAKGHRLALRSTPPSLEEIASLPLIGYRDARSHEHLEELLRGRGPEPRVVFRSDDNGAVQGMVAAGLGVALVPELAVDTRDPDVVALKLGDAVPPRTLCLVWHRDRYRSPAMRAFTSAAVRLCQDIVAPVT